MNVFDNLCEQSKEDLLKQLHSITFVVSMTALSSEVCLEIEILTNKGKVYQWIGYDDWKVFMLQKCEPTKWADILFKAKSNQLSRKDVAGTDIGRMLEQLFPGDANIDFDRLFFNFPSQESTLGEYYYCYYDENTLWFSPNQEGIRIVLQKEYNDVDEQWDEMDIEELRYWYSVFLAAKEDFPCVSFSNED